MEEMNLGPNGALIYWEFLVENIDWLQDESSRSGRTRCLDCRGRSSCTRTCRRW